MSERPVVAGPDRERRARKDTAARKPAPGTTGKTPRPSAPRAAMPQQVLVLQPPPSGSSEPPRAVMVPIEEAAPRRAPKKVAAQSIAPARPGRRPKPRDPLVPWRWGAAVAAAVFIAAAIRLGLLPGGLPWAVGLGVAATVSLAAAVGLVGQPPAKGPRKKKRLKRRRPR